MTKDVSGHIVIRCMWICVVVDETAGGSWGWRTGLHAYSPRTLGWRLLFVCIDFVTESLIDIENGIRYERFVLLVSFPFPPAACGRYLARCGAALLVTGMKHVVDPRVSVMASALSTCSLYCTRAICCLLVGNWMT